MDFKTIALLMLYASMWQVVLTLEKRIVEEVHAHNAKLAEEASIPNGKIEGGRCLVGQEGMVKCQASNANVTTQMLSTGPPSVQKNRILVERLPDGIGPSELDVMVEEHFSRFGTIARLAVNETERHAFIEYEQVLHARRALANYSNHQLNGHDVEVKAVVTGSLKPFGPVDATRIFVWGLPKHTDESVIAEHFGHLSPVRSVDLNRIPGFCYVTFESAVGAQLAIHAHDEHKINGKYVSVKFAEPAREEPSTKEERTENCGGVQKFKLTVERIPFFFDTALVRNYFAAFGTITKFKMTAMQQSATIWYEENVHARHALAHYNNHEINGQWVEVKPVGELAVNRNENNVEPRIFVWALSREDPEKHVEEAALTDYFSALNPVKKVELKMDSDGKPMHAYVYFETNAGVHLAVHSYDEHWINNEWVSLMVM